MIPRDRGIKTCDVSPDRLQSVSFKLKLNHLGYRLKYYRYLANTFPTFDVMYQIQTHYYFIAGPTLKQL